MPEPRTSTDSFQCGLTMVFGEPYDNELARYSTEEQAMRGHLKVLNRLRAGWHPFCDAEESVE